MKLVMTNVTDGSTRKFLNLDQAAKYFAYFNKASNEAAAKLNISCVLNGSQTTGSNSRGVENRNTAYGYTIRTVRG